MVNVKPILEAGLAVQSASLLGRNIKAAKKPLKKNNNQKQTGRLLKSGIENIVGISLIKSQGNIIKGI